MTLFEFWPSGRSDLYKGPLLSSFLLLSSALLVYKGLNCCESVYSPSMTEASVAGAYIVAGTWVTDLRVTVPFYLKIHLVESVSDSLTSEAKCV